VCVCSLRYPACNAHAPYCRLCPVLLYYIFLKLSHKRQEFRKKIYWTWNVLSFSLRRLSQTFLIIRIAERDLNTKCILVFMSSTRYSCPILMKPKFSREISDNSWIPPCGVFSYPPSGDSPGGGLGTLFRYRWYWGNTIKYPGRTWKQTYDGLSRGNQDLGRSDNRKWEADLAKLTIGGD